MLCCAMNVYIIAYQCFYILFIIKVQYIFQPFRVNMYIIMHKYFTV